MRILIDMGQAAEATRHAGHQENPGLPAARRRDSRAIASPRNVTALNLPCSLADSYRCAQSTSSKHPGQSNVALMQYAVAISRVLVLATLNIASWC
jgi:hypothetical protein